MNDRFTNVATARAAALEERIRQQVDQASIRYIFAPIFDMVCDPLSTVIVKGSIVPISEQGQPVGEVYLQTLIGQNETIDPAKYDLKDGIGEISINPAPIVDALLSQYGPQGAVQIKSLFNMEIGKFLEGRFNEIIFGGEEFNTAKAYHERFALVREQVGRSNLGPVIGRVISELEASVSAAFAWGKAKAEWSNQALKSGDLKKFSPYEYKLFDFTGVTPIDEAMNQVAVNQGALAQALPQVVTDLKEAVIESRPDWKEIGKSISEGVKEGVKEAIIAVQTQPAAAAAKEDAKTPAQAGNNRPNKTPNAS
jgi:hypothetical protein